MLVKGKRLCDWCVKLKVFWMLMWDFKGWVVARRVGVVRREGGDGGEKVLENIWI